MSDLVAWLRAQLDDDERSLAGSGDLGWLTYRRPDGTMAYTIPASLASDGEWIAVGAVARDFASATVVSCERERLAELDAKRRILAAHPVGEIGYCTNCWADRQPLSIEAPCPTLRLLCLPYASRPGYREEWKP